MSLRKISLIFILLLSLLLSSCQPAKESDREDKKLRVIATIFPIYDFARNIGGDKIKVTMLLPPGTDAHHYELKPEDIKKVSKADISFSPTLKWNSGHIKSSTPPKKYQYAGRRDRSRNCLAAVQ
jgi:ABC-type metal ion transport system, periplasmic component/surface adhesin